MKPAAGWRSRDGYGVNLPPLLLRFDCWSPFTVLYPGFVEWWGYSVSLVDFLCPLFPVHTLARGKGGRKVRRGLRIFSDTRSILAVRAFSALGSRKASLPAAVLTGSRLCFDRVFSRVLFSEYPAPGFSSLMRPTPGMHKPAKENDHAWIGHGDQQRPSRS